MKASLHSIKIETLKFGRIQHRKFITWSKRKIW